MATAVEVGPLFQPISFKSGVPALLAPPEASFPDDGSLKTFVGPLYQPVFLLPSSTFHTPHMTVPPPGGGSSTSGIII